MSSLLENTIKPEEIELKESKDYDISILNKRTNVVTTIPLSAVIHTNQCHGSYLATLNSLLFYKFYGETNIYNIVVNKDNIVDISLYLCRYMGYDKLMVLTLLSKMIK